MGEKAKSSRNKELALLWICGGMLAVLLVCQIAMILSLPSRDKKDAKADPAVAQAEPQRSLPAVAPVIAPPPQPPPLAQALLEPPAVVQEPEAPQDPLAEAFKDNPVVTPKQQAKKVRRSSVVTLGRVEKQVAPELELDRARAESHLDNDQDTVKIVTGFECSTPLKIEKISPTHFAVTVTTDTDLRNWFMFRLEGVKGKTLRIDIREAPLDKWWSLNPVYSYVPSIDGLQAFASQFSPRSEEFETACNGPLFPKTSAQQWHYISQVWGEKGNFCFVQYYDQDSAYLAMRCPYSVKYNENYIASLKGRPGVEVITIGRSKEGRELLGVHVGTGDIAKVPCIVMYAREHPDEQDTSWAVRGAIEWLLGNTSEAKELRSRINLIAIPILDPDGAAAGKYENFLYSFAVGQETPESTAYADYVASWCNKNGRIDLVINLHNIESAEGPHLFRFMASPDNIAYHNDEALFKIIQGSTDGRLHIGSGILHREEPLARFAWWISNYFGSQQVFYEINSQDSHRHLSLDETSDLGRVLIMSAGEFLLSDDGASMAGLINRRRNDRLTRWATASLETRRLNRVSGEILCAYEATKRTKVVGTEAEKVPP